MKIDRNKLKKSSTDVPVDCRPLIERLKGTSETSLLEELQSVKTWTYGKCELYHWADVLDIFDDVLEKACKKESDSGWTLACDVPANEDLKQLLLQVLHFTSLLIEHSFSRHLYNSMEHLTSLMSSCDMTVVLEVLNLLYVFSKRSNFLTRLSSDKKQRLISRLTHLAESWGGKDNGFGLADCCTDKPVSKFPGSATTLHFEFYIENADEKSTKKGASNVITCIHIDNLDQIHKLPTEIMEDLLVQFKIPEEKQTLLYTHIRLAKLFSKYETRVQCVQARLQAVAILVYSNAMQENMNALLYPGFIEELVDVIELKEAHLVDIKAASLRTLTSIIHLERNPKLNNIIDATGAASYHGFLPVLVRTCIQHMIDAELEPFPQQYSTALFSFLYHLASYENGVEALVSCGMMESLLKVINWFGEGQDHITFVTRAVRVVDLITNLDMAAFQSHGGLTAFINRLQHEVGICRKEHPFEIRSRRMDSSMDSQPESPPMAMETDASHDKEAHEGSGALECHTEPKPSTSTGTAHVSSHPVPDYSVAKTGLQCFPQRAALLKSMLNFLKKAIPDPAFSESIRHLMDGSLPKSLKHIISNAEYYGPSLFLLATDVVTVYVFQEPSLLSSLQDKGLTDVVLHALLIKDVPATREVLASLPNVFSALCLNARGLEAFVQCRPFDRLFKVLLSPDYLPAMRKRRSSDPFGDTASNLGNAMDELMRHQPSLRTDATKAIIQLLEEVCLMGQDPKYVCQKPQPKNEQSLLLSLPSPQPQDAGSSDEEEEEEEIPAEPSQEKAEQSLNTDSSQGATSQPAADKQAIPLMDYVLNVMKFIEAILSNNSTDDHCREFVNQKGLIPLMSILGLPNLPIDFPASPACQAVASVCKAILTLSREPQVLKQGLLQLNEVLEKLAPLHEPLEAPGGSVLLRELATATVTNPDSTLSPQATPLLHALSAAHAYIMMFVHVCRIGQTDIRTISVNHWGSELGLQVLSGLSKLYTSLVWESTVLLALCSDDILPPGCDFGRADMERLLPKDFKPEKENKDEDVGGSTLTRSTGELGSNGVSHAMESLTTSETNETPMEVTTESQQGGVDKDSKKSKMSPTLQAQVKQIKPLLSVSSRLGRALAELFGLLVKLSVGTRVRQRASQMLPPTPVTPTPAAQAVAKALTKLLADGLSWTPPDYSPVPKLRLTFLVCSVGFTSPMLFSDVKQPYHLMLQKFVSSGGQEALFKAFEWALSVDGMVLLNEGLEHPDLPGGTGEFLDAWLMLIEKMVNPKTVLETPHTLPMKSSQANFVPFDPVTYLIKTQKAAFNAVMHLWNKKPLKIYGSRMSESILAILCHIIKAESIIKECFEKEKDQDQADVAASSGGSIAVVGGRSEESQVNPAHLQQLMDMGFSRERCLESLSRTSSIVQATDYLLTHAGPPPPGLGLDLDMTEEDQMMRAIAMSLGENAVMSTDQADNSKLVDKKEETEEMEKPEEPLDKACLDNFTEKLFPGCLTLLDTLQETVYRACDLITVVTQRNGAEWQKRVLSDLVAEVQSLAQTILSLAPSSDTEATAAQTQADKIANMPESARFATRIHLFSLLFEVNGSLVIESLHLCPEASLKISGPQIQVVSELLRLKKLDTQDGSLVIESLHLCPEASLKISGPQIQVVSELLRLKKLDTQDGSLVIESLHLCPEASLKISGPQIQVVSELLRLKKLDTQDGSLVIESLHLCPEASLKISGPQIQVVSELLRLKKLDTQDGSLVIESLHLCPEASLKISGPQIQVVSELLRLKKLDTQDGSLVIESLHLCPEASLKISGPQIQVVSELLRLKKLDTQDGSLVIESLHLCPEASLKISGPQIQVVSELLRLKKLDTQDGSLVIESLHLCPEASLKISGPQIQVVSELLHLKKLDTQDGSLVIESLHLCPEASLKISGSQIQVVSELLRLKKLDTQDGSLVIESLHLCPEASLKISGPQIQVVSELLRLKKLDTQDGSLVIESLHLCPEASLKISGPQIQVVSELLRLKKLDTQDGSLVIESLHLCPEASLKISGPQIQVVSELLRLKKLDTQDGSLVIESLHLCPEASLKISGPQIQVVSELLRLKKLDTQDGSLVIESLHLCPEASLKISGPQIQVVSELLRLKKLDTQDGSLVIESLHLCPEASLKISGPQIQVVSELLRLKKLDTQDGSLVIESLHLCPEASLKISGPQIQVVSELLRLKKLDTQDGSLVIESLHLCPEASLKISGPQIQVVSELLRLKKLDTQDGSLVIESLHLCPEASLKISGPQIQVVSELLRLKKLDTQDGSLVIESLHLCPEASLKISGPQIQVVSELLRLKKLDTQVKKLFQHLVNLQEAMMPCAEALENTNMTDLLVQVLVAGKNYLTAVKQSSTPKWLAPLLILLDLYEKVSVISKRKAEAEKMLANCHTWKWFDDSSGRWCKYSVANNKTIDDAYQNGETTVRFQAGRRRYTVHFSSMVQVNEETGNRRPIMLTLPGADERQQNKDDQKEENTFNSQPLENKMETDVCPTFTNKMPRITQIVQGLNSDQITDIIRSVVSLIGIPVESETLHAALRLVLRLTREHKYALLFAELGGSKLLLGLTQASAFQGFLSLATLLFRHVLEDPNSLKSCMEEVVKSACSGSGSSMSGVSQGSLGAKEVHYILRVLGPAACRNALIFTDVAKESLRIALPPPAKRDEDEARLTGPSAPQILRCIATQSMTSHTLDYPLRGVVEDLLNALVIKYNWKEEGSGNGSEFRAQTLAEAIAEVVSGLSERHQEMMRQNSTAELPPTDEENVNHTLSAAEPGSSKDDKHKDKDSKSTEESRKHRPLLPKSALLRLLSEIIKSYSSCTQLITQYVYPPGLSELVLEECSVLAFVLDQLLPQCQNAGDKDCPALSRVFIASIASCNHSPDAQLTLVCEVKAALQRALALPESSDKHARILALTSLVSTMIEACPTPGQIPNQVFKGQQNLLGRPSPMNNIVKNLLKKGLVTDLARIAHSLDLSSPYMASTINAALKPLETLSRNVNQPLQSVAAKPKPKSEEPGAGPTEENNTTTPSNEQAAGTGVMTTVARNSGGGDLQIEDITEHSDQHEDLEETEPLEAVEPARVSQEADLEDVLDELLHRDRGASHEDEVIGEIIMETEPSQVTDESQDVIIDVEVEEESMDHHDSQMISQVSEGDEEETEEEDDVNQTAHSVHGDEDDTAESGSEADDEDNDDGVNDEDDQDEEDEDEEGDEGSDMEADDDDYIDVDETSMGQNYNDTFVIHADSMFPPGSTQHIIFNALDNGQVRTYQMPISFNDNDNGNDAAVPSMPPAPSNVPASHPLLLRQSDAHSIMGISRVQRGRQRGTCRYNPSTQTLHVNFPRQPNPPVILQRLLGPTTAADVLQLTNSLTTQAGPNHTRVVLSNNDLRIISRPEEDILEELFQDTYPEGSGGTASGVLSCIPTTLTRWTEEAKVLDGDSVHNCVAALKTEIFEVLEKYRDDELAERREKRRKNAEEEVAKKKEEEEKARSSGANTSTPQNMEVSQNSAVAAADVHHGVTTDPQVLSSIPLPTTTVAALSQDSSAYPARQITSEAASAAEAIASQIVETVLSNPLSSSYYSSTPNYSSEGIYHSMPHPMASIMSGLFEPGIVPPPTQFQPYSDLETPITLPVVPPPRSIPRSDFLSRFRVPLSTPVAHPLVSMTTTPQQLNPTRTSAITSASALLGDLSFANITVPPTSLVTPGLAMSMSASSFITPSQQGLPIRTPSAPMIDRHRMPPVREGELPMASADMFPSHLVPPTTNVSSLASLLLNEDDGIMDHFTAFGTMGVQPTPATTAVLTTSTSRSEPSNTMAHQSSSEGAGALTPEEVSNITSSDAATVHSSGSDSPQEFSMGGSSVADRNLANLASIAEGISLPTVTSDRTTTASTTDSSSESNTTSSTSTSATAHSSSSGEAVSSEPSSAPLLAGVDPSFLAALPDGIRQEVIAEQLRLQRLQQQHAQRQQPDNNATSVLEVSQEFLAALPPSIQEEVLAQQRLEQERLNAQNQAQSNPETPVDPTTFFASLPPSLRQSVLADMDDSMMAVLPPDLATEAQSLRREFEDRHRRLMQERLFTQGSSGSLSAILRHAGTLRYTLRGAPRGGGQWSFGSGRLGGQGTSAVSSVRVKGRHLLDHEGLTCLLILLFVDEPKINTGRLHRVLRNLCYHGPTRAWVVKSMLSILQRTGECKEVDEKDKSKSPDKGKGKRSAQPMQTDSSVTTKSDIKNQGSWLSISLEAALGCRANVFQVQRSSGRKHTASTNNAVITIHPQASPVVCRHVLDALISLAKMFPYQFLPASASKAKEVQKCDSEKEKESDKQKQQTPGTSGSPKVSAKSDKLDVKADTKDTDFWELLLKLDSASSSKKGKSLQRTHSSISSENEPLSKDFDSAPIGHLMLMLSHPVIKRSQLLTDRLLRLLGLISTGLSDSQRLQPTTTAVGRILRTVYTYATAPSTQRATTTTTTTMSTPTSSAVASSMSSAGRPSVGTVASLTAPSGVVASSESAHENKEKSKEEKKNEEKKDDEEKDEAAVLEKQLHLAVQVLTSKSCSEEGLEDATNLLLQLSRANNATRISVLKLLLDGGWELGMTVCYHIRSLLLELRELKCKESENDDSEEGKEMDISPSQPSGKGVMEDRFTPGTKIVVSAPKKIKGGRELQLPSMSLFTSKASSQHFFLRILKVIIQLREAARSAGKKNNRKKELLPAEDPVSQDLGQIAEAMALQEAEAEAILQIVHRRENRAHTGSRVIAREAAPPAAGQALEVTQGQGSSQYERAPTAAGQSRESPMETDKPGSSTEGETKEEKEDDVIPLPRLSEQLQLEELWHALGECLTELAKTPDQHAVLILQPAVEAFFIVHAGEKDNKQQQEPPQTRKEDQLAHLNSMDIGPASPAGASASTTSTTDSHPPALSRENSLQMVANTAHLPPDTQKFLKFADTHRTVLNQILRQSTTPLADGPFSVLVDHTRILDFDVKRRYFRQELDRLDEGTRREDLAVHVRREHVFEDSFRELFRRTADEWKHRFYIVFEGEEGQDAGGLLREWYIIISREIFNPMYALFRTSPGDRVTYTINPSSHCNSNHLSYFKFVGRIIAKAIYDNKLLECYFTRSFYKHIIGQSVKYTDMESEDYSFYQGLVFLMEHHVEELGYDLTFSTEIQEFGVTEVRDLKPNGRNIPVTEENKKEYVKLVCQMKMTGAIRKQLNAFLEGFYDIIPKRLTSIFNEQELELLISGLPTIDIDDLKANTEYHKYQPNSLQVQWFWRALRSFDQADRARFLQFVTGTSKVPLQGFSHLEGMNGVQKFQIHRDDRSTDRLPAAHTCFNQLDLPAYETYDKLRHMLLLAVNECSEGFGLA